MGPIKPGDVFKNKILQPKTSRRECVKPERERERERRSLCMLHHVSELNASRTGVRGRGGRQRAELQRITGPAGRDEGGEIGWRGQEKERGGASGR